MEPSRIILAALLFAAILFVWLSVVSIQPSHVRSVAAPAVPQALAMVPNDAVETGIVSDPNFQTVLQALKQRAGEKKLAEPEVVTVNQRAINRSYYHQTFTLPLTNR
jgi:hypothetical protein